jgi:lipoprotein NlpD
MCCLLLGGCADTAADGPPTYIVHPQDTLYSIAWRHDLDYRDLARWNNLGTDFRIAVGQVLVLGPGWGVAGEPAPPRAAPPAAAPAPARTPTPAPGAAGPGAPGTQASEAPRVSKPRPLPAPPPQLSTPPPAGSAPPTSPVPSTGGAPPARAVPRAQDLPPASGQFSGGLKWVWPTDRTLAPRPVPGGGILLSGRLGQDVRAASAGRVVYTGSGMRGYGNLIIIKHADSWLSAYAHNREMLVHEGQDVATGQVIAHMGEGGPRSPALYFEIRQNGRPVDPLPLLPKVK